MEKKVLEKIIQECTYWEGASYRHMGDSVLGIDCTKLIAHILIGAGLLSQYDSTYYPHDWFMHNKEEVIVSSLKQNAKYLKDGYKLKVWKYKPGFKLQSGDCLLFKLFHKMPCNHTGFYFEDPIGGKRIFHADYKKGVCYTQFIRLWKKRTKFVARLEEVEK